MADRVFHIALLLVAIGYTIIAFTTIKAPFQYDPLGPESWPRLLGFLAIACSVWIVVKPDVSSLGLGSRTVLRLALLLLILSIYAYLFEPLGFVFSTWLFCIALGRMLGAAWMSASLFGAIAGIGGYLLFTVVLDLNLPAGILKPLL
ncbi:MAG: tripartite tricarboxylate transporter TctB family protein [Hoeflea sp.]|uniref:tripartite tricarboxylate transporter TctB family protein n=1 Tax=Hoeflea sp. TaxID=1940281 RepID=UPI0032EDC9D3